MAFQFDKLIKDPKYGFIFEKDRDFLEGSLTQGDWRIDYNTDETCLQLGLRPQQVVGDVNKAKVFLLNLNPSFKEQDFKDEIILESYIEDTLRLDFSSTCLKDYPFYCLNPDLSSTDGAVWWNNGYHFGSYKKVGYTPDQLAKRFCCIELIPYHAANLKPRKLKGKLIDCPSVKNVIEFYQNVLIPKAKKREILIICLRSAKEWRFKEDTASNMFMGTNVQRACFSSKGSYFNEIHRLI